jgi:hypothetical protein
MQASLSKKSKFKKIKMRKAGQRLTVVFNYCVVLLLSLVLCLSSVVVVVGVSVEQKAKGIVGDDGTWQDWIQHFGHDVFQYPSWLADEMEGCSCAFLFDEGDRTHPFPTLKRVKCSSMGSKSAGKTFINPLQQLET